MTQSYADYFEFYTEGPFAPFLQESRSLGTSPIKMAHVIQPAGDFSDPAHKDIVLTFVKASCGHVTRDFGEGRRRVRGRAGDFEIQPPDTATEVLAEAGHEIILYQLPFDRVAELAGETVPDFDGDFGNLHALPFRDFHLESLCRQLWRESVTGNQHGNLFADGLLICMIATLLHLRDGTAPGGPTPSWSLSAVQCARIEAYVEAHMDVPFGVADLADLVDLPHARFTQALKAATGYTPHQYVLSCRIARAQQLLADDRAALADVAYACGFASQSHMTDVFRNKLGVTPGRYRKEVRG